jgi:hypothetical protein
MVLDVTEGDVRELLLRTSLTIESMAINRVVFRVVTIKAIISTDKFSYN